MLETRTLEPDKGTGFLKDICAYFRDFLDTDFKRQSAPKRSITLKDPAGNLTGIDAAKYPDLTNEVWRLLRKPIDDNPAFSLAVPRGRYRGRLRAALQELIEKHLQTLTEDDLNAIADRGSVAGRAVKAQLENDPDRYAETVTHAVKSDLVHSIVVPVLMKLEAALARARRRFRGNVQHSRGTGRSANGGGARAYRIGLGDRIGRKLVRGAGSGSA